MSETKPETPSADGALTITPRTPDEYGLVRRHGGARPGAGRPSLAPIERKARARDRLALERARRPVIAKLLRFVRDPKWNLVPLTERGLWLKAALELLNRAGIPARIDLTGDLNVAMLTPELLNEAMRAAAQLATSDPSRGAVQATDAEFEVVMGTNGDSQTVQ